MKACFFILLLAGASLQVSAQDGAEVDPMRFLMLRLQERADEDGSVQPYNEELMFLAEVYGTRRAEAYYDGVFEQIEEAADPSSLPAIELLLNRDIWGKPRNLPANAMVWPYVERASELWYDIAWKDADAGRKAETAMYGLRPDTPVRLYPATSVERLRLLGDEGARQAMYASLLTDGVTYTADGWAVNGVTELSRLLMEKAFRPTDEELKKIAGGSNDFAQMAAIAYLLKAGSPAGVDMLVAWIDRHARGGNEDLLMHGINYLGSVKPSTPGRHKEALAESTIAASETIYERFRGGRVSKPRDIWFMTQINVGLLGLGDRAISRDYFVRYQEMRDAMVQTDQELEKLAGQSIHYADRYAERALAEWAQ